MRKQSPLKPANQTTIKRIRGEGAWCLLSGDPDYMHYMVCNRSDGQVAISLCWQRIRTFAQCSLKSGIKHCKTCEDYLSLRKEVTNRHNQKQFVVRRRVNKIHHS